MPFINEDIIEQIADRLDAQPENYEILVREFQEAQPALIGYILSEDTAFLTPDERDYFLYLGLIIWDAIRSQQPELAQVTAYQISDTEDLN